MSDSSFFAVTWSTNNDFRSAGPETSSLGDDVRSVTPETLSLGNDIRSVDSESDIACSSGRPEVPDFGPYRVYSILFFENLEVLRLKYQISSEYELEGAVPVKRIALPCPDRVGLYEEALKVEVRLPFHYLIVEFLYYIK